MTTHGHLEGLTNRRGRKRRFRGSKPGAREILVVELTPTTRASQLPHRRCLPVAVRHDQKAVSELGRMNLFGRISDDMETAGSRFARHFGAYQATIDSPRGVAGAGRGYDCMGALPCDDCECARRKSVYLDALKALQTAGAIAVRAVFLTAVQDRVTPWPWLRPLDWGLCALVRHYGIGDKSTNRRP